MLLFTFYKHCSVNFILFSFFFFLSVEKTPLKAKEFVQTNKVISQKKEEKKKMGNNLIKPTTLVFVFINIIPQHHKIFQS